MAITGINNSSYTSYYASNYKNTVKKTDSEKDSTNTKDGNVTTSTVELKTSRPGVTKTEQIKTGYSNVNDYSKYLQGKYHYMNIGLTSMQGIPTTVSVSSAFLQKCMNDPEKAKYLEENLAAIPDCTKDTINGCLGTVTNQSYMIDANLIYQVQKYSQILLQGFVSYFLHQYQLRIRYNHPFPFFLPIFLHVSLQLFLPLLF